MRIPILRAGLALLFAAAPAAAQQDAAYAAMLARFQAGDSTVDAGELRMAYTRTSRYDPYGTGGMDDARAMMQALNAGRHPEGAQAAERVLARNWLDITAHLAAAYAYEEMGSDSAAAVHATAARRLLESIGKPEDGRSERAPMRVIEVAEEYAWLRAHGLRPAGQGLADCGAVRCDAMQVVDEKGSRFTVYFDVDTPYQWMAKRMGGGNEKP